MSTKTITDLREVLFDTLQKLKDRQIDLETARGVNELSKTLIDSAKVEVEYLRAVDGSSSPFIDGTPQQPEELPQGITGRTVHRLR